MRILLSMHLSSVRIPLAVASMPAVVVHAWFAQKSNHLLRGLCLVSLWYKFNCSQICYWFKNWKNCETLKYCVENQNDFLYFKIQNKRNSEQNTNKEMLPLPCYLHVFALWVRDHRLWSDSLFVFFLSIVAVTGPVTSTSLLLWW